MGYRIRTVSLDFVRAFLPEIVRKSYKNVDITAHILQYCSECRFAAAFKSSRLSGLVSLLRNVSSKNIAFYCPDPHSAADLLGHMQMENPDLRNEPMQAVLDCHLSDILENSGHLISCVPQYRMRYSASRIEMKSAPGDINISRLAKDNIAEISKIYSAVPDMNWNPRMLLYGPYYGAFDGSMLTAIAGVHFNNRYAAELGNIVTIPLYRRRGLARLCTQAVLNNVFKRDKIIYLNVLTDNIPAVNLYLNLGFEVTEISYSCKFFLTPVREDAVEPGIG